MDKQLFFGMYSPEVNDKKYSRKIALENNFLYSFDSSYEIKDEDLKKYPLLKRVRLTDSPLSTQKFNSKGELFATFFDAHYIYKLNHEDNFIKIYGTGKAGYKDGKGEEAEFNYPTGLSFDANDNLYVADTGNHAIRKITPDGTVTTFYKQE